MRCLILDMCFSLDRLLTRFFADASTVSQFRAIQRRTGALVSGSIALQLFDRSTWPESDLDLYVSSANSDVDIVVGFIERDGYKLDSPIPQGANLTTPLDIASIIDENSTYPLIGIEDVLTFCKGNKKIQVVLTTSTPMEVVLGLHSTCVMNVITSDRAFALYPWATFVTKEALIVDTVRNQQAGRQKYTDRGWTMIPTSSLSSNSELGVRVARSLGDRFTWTMPLDPVNYGIEEIANFELLTSWHLDYGQKGEFLIQSTLFRMLSAEEDSLENALYKTLHAAIMKVEDKLDTYGETSNLFPLEDFIIFVLTAILLIAEDKNLNIEDAADVRDASNEFGQLMQADDDSDEEIQNLHQGNVRATNRCPSNPPFSQPPRHNRKKFDIIEDADMKPVIPKPKVKKGKATKPATNKRVSLASSSHLRLTTHQVLHAHLHMASQTTRTPSAPALCQSLRDEARTLVATTHSIANSRLAQSRPNSRSIAFPARALHRTVVFILHDRVHSHTRTTALKHIRSLRLTSWPLDLVVVAVFTIRFPLYQVHFLCCHLSPLAVWHRTTAWKLFAGCVLVLTLSVFTLIDYHHVLVHRVSRSSSHANVKKGGPIVLSIEENFHGRSASSGTVRLDPRRIYCSGPAFTFACPRPEPHVRPRRVRCPAIVTLRALTQPRAVGRFHHWLRRARPRPWSRGRMAVPSDGVLSSNQKRGGAFEIRPQFWDDVAGWPASRAGWDGRTVYVVCCPLREHARGMQDLPAVCKFILALLLPAGALALKPFALVTSARAADAEALRAEAQAHEPADAARIGFRACSKVRWDVLNAEYLAYRADPCGHDAGAFRSDSLWDGVAPLYSVHAVLAGTLFVSNAVGPDEQSLADSVFQTMTQLRAPFGITASTIVFNALEHNAGCRGLDALKSRLQLIEVSAALHSHASAAAQSQARFAGRESDVPPAALRNVSPLHTRRPPTDINAALKDIVFENVLGEHIIGFPHTVALFTSGREVLLHACSSPSSRYAGILTTDPNAVPELLPALYLTPACTAFGVLHNSSPSPVRELTRSGAHHEVNKHARLDLFRTKIKSGIWVGYRMGWFWK
ncbi:hypothetical protein GGX14DRAFT_569168 [Mycena pura]|uniref:Uncharacterized protein n=1 Tax=Mycena pura TaxID=153505 RepID=A0AAD6YE58_9AGAR|nr:hypothetical protein GGX14DRAFT_569168 [Mycena pura]